MADARTLRQKLEAMALQTEQSPHEAAIARRVLGKLRASVRNSETPGILTREAVMGTPTSKTPPRYVRVKVGGYWIALDEAEYEVVFGRKAPETKRSP